MPKPDWLVEQERNKSRPQPRMCKDCIYYGPVVSINKLRRSGKVVYVEIHECEIHPGCFNGDRAVCCEDWLGQYQTR